MNSRLLLQRKEFIMQTKQISVIVFCATALATSTMVSMRLKNELEKRGLNCTITTGRISDMASLVNMSKPDVVVATAVSNMDIGQPIFNGVPLLTNIGTESLVDDIVDYLINKGLVTK